MTRSLNPVAPDLVAAPGEAARATSEQVRDRPEERAA